jgi:hypothetical protein
MNSSYVTNTDPPVAVILCELLATSSNVRTIARVAATPYKLWQLRQNSRDHHALLSHQGVALAAVALEVRSIDTYFVFDVVTFLEWHSPSRKRGGRRRPS